MAGFQVTAEVLDAWSIVDSLHRLRGLLKHIPGIKGRDRVPEIRTFFDVTEKIPELRNTVQHLDTTIPGVIDDKDWAVLGSLNWAVLDPEKKEITASVFYAGTAMGARPFLNPASRKKWHMPVDAITIERSGVAVCLSDAMRRVADLAAGLERNLALAYNDQIPNPEKYQPSDVILSVVIDIGHKQIVPEPGPESPS